jgi:hypothetical protein
MYDHLEKHNLPRDKKETKLTQLLSTHGKHMSFGMYELWGLIDNCHFIVDSVKTVLLFTKHDKMGTFVNSIFGMRVAAKTMGENTLMKNILNSSYGSDGQNNEKFTNIKFVNKQKALLSTVHSNFLASSKITENLYMVESDPERVSCKKPLQSAYATLSNAKYWFITFVYRFLYMCLDKERFHFIVCDTDSYMWAVANRGERERVLGRILGGLRRKIKIVNHFEDIVVDRAFYESNYSLFFPKKKSLMTLEYEHCCQDLIALAPKNYWCTDGKKTEFRSKGVTVRGNLNTHLREEKTVYRCLKEQQIVGAANYVLRQKDNKMTKQRIEKTGISGVMTKAIVLKNQSCLPFICGKKSTDYYC